LAESAALLARPSGLYLRRAGSLFFLAVDGANSRAHRNQPLEGTMLPELRLIARRHLLASLIAAVGIAACHMAVAAESFRIETKIFVGEEKEKQEPISQSTTMFHDGIVYDFLENPQQTAVFRKPTGEKPARFILLYDQRQIQTEISTEKLVAAMKDLRTWAAQQRDPFLQFAANPQFDETFDRVKGKLELVSYLQTYTVETSPTQRQDALGPYREYLDWYTQLNTLLVTKIPPDPRLKLNDALARHKAIPTKVELKRKGEDPVRAEHDFTWRLSQQDLQRIEDVRANLSTYQTVGNAEFLQQSKPAEK
jgi:hypothetical protein